MVINIYSMRGWGGRIIYMLSGAMSLLGILFWAGKYSCKILAFVTEESDKLKF